MSEISKAQYNIAIAKKPALGRLAKVLDLELIGLQSKTENIDVIKVRAYANKILQRDKAYSEATILRLTIEHSAVNIQRAEKGFRYMLQAGVIVSAGAKYKLSA